MAYWPKFSTNKTCLRLAAYLKPYTPNLGDATVALSAVLAFGILIYYHWSRAPKIIHTASEVEGFELRYTNLAPNEFPLFGPENAIWANYPFFVFDGNTYERAGSGGVIIRKGAPRKTRYLVEETIEKHDSQGMQALRSRLSIIDKETNITLGKRRLEYGQVENQSAWVGDHAAYFVRAVLNTNLPIGGWIGAKPYPQAPVNIEPQSTHRSYGAIPKGCPTSYAIGTHRHKRTLDTPTWRFLPQSPISSVVCAENKIVILSHVYPDDLYIDVLSEQGTSLFQSELRINISADARVVQIDRASFKGSVLELDLGHFIFSGPYDRRTWNPYRFHRVRLSMVLKNHNTKP